jgi:type IV pilus assembly protein PilM
MSLPKFFGLDIGSSSIKLVLLKHGSKMKLEKIGSIETPSGTYGNPDEVAKKKLASAIRELFDQLKVDTKNVVMAISERDVFSSKIKFPFEDEKNIEEGAYWATSKILPVPIETVNTGYLPIMVSEENNTKVMEALAISVEKKIAEHYAEILDLAELNPLALETEAVALVRSIAHNLDPKSLQESLILDMGSNSTCVAIIKGRNLMYSTSIPTGSDVITRSIAQSFNLDQIQAEEYKKTYGLNEKVFEGRIAEVVKPVLDSILMDVNRSIQFYRQEQVNNSLESIKLLGESSLMPGLIAYVTKYLGLSAEILDPFLGIDNAGLPIDKKQSFSVALGLALKEDFS